MQLIAVTNTKIWMSCKSLERVLFYLDPLMNKVRHFHIRKEKMQCTVYENLYFQLPEWTQLIPSSL